jgi:hypothetical protein
MAVDHLFHAIPFVIDGIASDTRYQILATTKYFMKHTITFLELIVKIDITQHILFDLCERQYMHHNNECNRPT